MDRLALFVAEIGRWSRGLNLVSRGDLSSIWERHVLDSVQLAPLIPAAVDRAIDIGSGGGFPGLVLSIVTGLSFDLIEADQRKSAFLREAARITGAPARVHAKRIEAAMLPPAPLVTARALAPVGKLLEISRHLATEESFFLFPKGVTANEELTAAEAKWNMQAERYPSRLPGGGVLLRISKVGLRA